MVAEVIGTDFFAAHANLLGARQTVRLSWDRSAESLASGRAWDLVGTQSCAADGPGGLSIFGVGAWLRDVWDDELASL